MPWKEIVEGAAALGGALIGGRSQNRAVEAEERARADALAFEREQAEYERTERERAFAEYQRQYDAWQAMRMALLKRYGFLEKER